MDLVSRWGEIKKISYKGTEMIDLKMEIKLLRQKKKKTEPGK